MMSVLIEVIYSAPLSVETMTEIKARRECQTFFLSMERRLRTNLFQSFV
jgi:hypothetical protein